MRTARYRPARPPAALAALDPVSNITHSQDPTEPTDQLAARSLARVWHPCTQMKDHERELPLVPIASAEGAWLTGTDGRRYLDAIGSWWTNIFGHRHPHIVARLKQQLDALDHVIFAGFT